MKVSIVACLDHIINCTHTHTATTSRLERELAEAVQEEGDQKKATRDSSPTSDEDPGSDSDSECGENSGPPLETVNSMEASLWSLDLSASSSMETSVYTETEVSV